MYFDDLLKKVTDMFDKGYSYSAPFTFKLTANTPYSLSLNSKSEFVPRKEHLGLDWEYKLRHERKCAAGSFLCSSSKLEVETELWPCAKKSGMIRAKGALKPATSSETTNKFFSLFDMYGDLEFKYHGMKHFYATLKLLKDYKCNVPTLKLTSLYRFKPHGIIAATSCTFDSKVNRPSPLEFLVGFMPKKNALAYLKHSATNLKYPGKLTLGLFKTGEFDLTWPKKAKTGMIDKKFKWRVQTAAEGSIDLSASNKIEGKIGAKIMSKKNVTLQTMFDSNMQWISALTYHPSTKFNFILSEKFDFSKFRDDPKGGFFNSGFTVEMLW